jgi:hypothetical protein
MVFSATLLCLAVWSSGLNPVRPAATGIAPRTQQTTSDVDEWLTKPTTIVLSAEQRAHVDSIKVHYNAERRATMDAIRGSDDMNVVLKTRELEGKYRKQVRDLLTPEQQTVFDKNIATQKFVLSKPGRGQS